MRLTDFLLARIAEVEAEARAGMSPSPTDRGWHTVECAMDAVACSCRYGDHVLAECEAKRKVIDVLVRSMEGDYAPWNEAALRALVLPYADHPDYDETWRP